MAPLRPGTRLRGLNGFFWQSFVFEQLEGLCHRCASLHLSGGCPAAVEDSAEPRQGDVCFGPWLTAVRKRSSVTSGRAGDPAKHSSSGHFPHGSEKMNTAPSPSSSAPMTAAPVARQGQAQENDGWVSPAYRSRRRRVRRSVVDRPQQEAPGQLPRDLPSREPKGKADAGTVACAVLKQKGKQTVELGSLASQSEHSDSIQSPNPFASLVLEFEGEGSKGNSDATLGPLKRARPVEYKVARLSSQRNQKNGKSGTMISKAKIAKPNELVKSKADKGPLGQCLSEDMIVGKVQLSPTGLKPGDQKNREDAVMLTQEAELPAPVIGSKLSQGVGQGSSGCVSDCDMEVGQEASPILTQSE